MSKEEFKEKARQIQGDTYDYRNISDIDLKSYTKIPIICEKHGVFYDTVYNHLQGKICLKCFLEKIKMAD